jgi:hypothetical protein
MLCVDSILNPDNDDVLSSHLDDAIDSLFNTVPALFGKSDDQLFDSARLSVQLKSFALDLRVASKKKQFSRARFLQQQLDANGSVCFN